MKKPFKFGLLALAALFVTMTIACDNGTTVVDDDTKITLTASTNVTVGKDDTTAAAVFTFTDEVSAGDLVLSSADFTLSNGLSLAANNAIVVNTTAKTVTVNVTFAANDTADDKIYSVGIASGSAKITGTTSVTITQVAHVLITLTAFEDLSVGKNDTATAAVFTFTAEIEAGDLDLTEADFTLDDGLSFAASNAIEVDTTAKTVTVNVTFAVNTTSDEKTYTVGIASNSSIVTGTTSVIITQGPHIPVTLTAFEDLAVGKDDTAAAAVFTFTAEIEAGDLDLTEADFTLDDGLSFAASNAIVVDTTDKTVTVNVTFAANETADDKIYSVGIASGSNKITGTTSVTITQVARVLITLTAFDDLSAGKNDTAAAAVFTFTDEIEDGVLDLTEADFTLSDGLSFAASNAIEVDATAKTVTVNVTFAVNTTSDEKTYTVGIAGNSSIVTGTTSVIITQGPHIPITLTADGNLVVGKNDTTAAAVFTFTAETETGDLDLGEADFTLSDGLSFAVSNAIEVDTTAKTVTVNVTFAVNDADNENIFTVGIASESNKITGTTSVTITQKPIALTAGNVVVGESDTSAAVVFNFTAEISELDLTEADFTLSGDLSFAPDNAIAVNIPGKTVTVNVTFDANNTADVITHTVGIANSSDTIIGTTAVTITQFHFLVLNITEFNTSANDFPGVIVGPDGQGAHSVVKNNIGNRYETTFRLPSPIDFTSYHWMSFDLAVDSTAVLNDLREFRPIFWDANGSTQWNNLLNAHDRDTMTVNQFRTVSFNLDYNAGGLITAVFEGVNVIILRFTGVDGTNTNPGRIYIRNIRLYEDDPNQ